MLRLGLDVGTNSVGWCLTRDDEQIVGIGVRIFSDGRDPKSGASLAVDRRLARSMRRRRDRYLRRRSVFLETLIQHQLMPADVDEAKLIAAHDPYVLRARALEGPLNPYEIGRALFHLNQRRGFLSNRKAERKVKDVEDGKIAGGAKALDHAMAEAGADTLGQFLAGRTEKRVRLNSESQEYDFYPQRRHIEYEFGRIWEEQAKHHPVLLTEQARAALHRILFFQRPLKAPKVGVCLFAGRNGVPQDEARLPKAHPLFQERRLYEEVNQLAITIPGEASRPLSLEQRDRLILELRGKRKVSFAKMAKALKLQPGESFNKASENRTDMLGDEVHAMMADKKRFGNGWAHLSRERQWTIVERLIEEENPDTLHEFLSLGCGLDVEHAWNAAKAPLPEGYGRLGQTATLRILNELKKDVIPYSKAVELAGWHHSDERTGEVLDRLPYYGEILSRDIPPGSFDPKDIDNPEIYWGKITNPTVHIGLRQLQKLVNGIIAVHGRPEQIVVELARELKLNEEDKEEHKRRIRKDTEAAVARGQKLVQESIPDTGANRALLKLWEELNPGNPLDRRCPYCGEPIGMHALFSGEADIEHIIPYSRCLDDSTGNKVVAHRSCNRSKGNKTPYERWGHDEARWDKIAEQVERLHKSKQWRFAPDAMQRVERDGGFLARQLTDTQYLSRLAGKYLGCLYPTKDDGSVYVTPGRMTAMLRRLWGLNSLLPDHNYVENAHSGAPKNRLDHRHHAIDAAVIAVTTRGLLQIIARTAGQAEDKNLDRLFEDLPQPWNGFREELGEALRGVTVSHKADHGRKSAPSRHRDVTGGRLHNDTAYGLTVALAPDGKTPIVVHRVPIGSLKPEDLDNVERIPDNALRNALKDATRGLSGKEFDAALARFRDAEGPFKGLRRVRVREPLNVIAIRDKSGRAYKAYKGDANARYDVWRMPGGRWLTSWKDADGIQRSGIVSMFDAHQPSSTLRPHPAAKRVLSLRQNDLLAIEQNGGAAEIVRVVKFSTTGTIVLAPANEGGPLKARNSAPDDPFRYINSSAGGLQKLKARQIRIDPIGRVFDPGPRD